MGHSSSSGEQTPPPFERHPGPEPGDAPPLYTDDEAEEFRIEREAELLDLAWWEAAERATGLDVETYLTSPQRETV